jgi:SAM-dependent methyltransferase
MTVARWAELHDMPKHQLRYASEHVVRWLAGLQMYEGKALDIGSGHGRHIALMHKFGFSAVGVDAVPASNAWLGDMCELPFDDDLFDIALAYGVFYYGTREDHLKAIFELYRVLKPGGHALVVTRTFRDSRAKDERVDDYTRRMTEGDERGMLINFLEATDVEEDYKMFSGLNYELTETTRTGRRWRDSDWLITVTK